MILHPLDSAENKMIRTVIHLLSSRRFRERGGRAVVEGRRIVEEALSSGVSFQFVLYSPRFLQDPHNKSVLARLQAQSVRLLYVTDRLLESISAVETSQGILGVIDWSLPQRDFFPPTVGPSLFVVAEAVQDPGNLGTLIRSAQACGAHGLGVTRGTVEVFNPKTLRASAGSVFRMPIFQLSEDWVECAVGQAMTLRTTDVSAHRAYDEVSWTEPVIVVLGNEGNGLRWASEHGEAMHIPMVPTADSLNVAIAGSIILFHAVSVRRRAGIFQTPLDVV